MYANFDASDENNGVPYGSSLKSNEVKKCFGIHWWSDTCIKPVWDPVRYIRRTIERETNFLASFCCDVHVTVSHPGLCIHSVIMIKGTIFKLNYKSVPSWTPKSHENSSRTRLSRTGIFRFRRRELRQTFLFHIVNPIIGKIRVMRILWIFN